MTLQCIASDLRTNVVLARLPGVMWQWPLRAAICRYDTGTARLLLTDKTAPSWERATLPGAAVLHLYDDTDPARKPLWSGFVTTRTRDIVHDAVDLSLATLEAYFDRRVIGTDLTYTATGQNSVLADLVARFIQDGAVPGVQLQVVTGGANTSRDETYKGVDFATVYTRFSELAGLTGGPEWTADYNWAADGQHLVPTLTIADRLGAAAPPGLLPRAKFTTPKLLDAKLVEQYDSSTGANRVNAYSSGQGSITPTSGWQAAADMAGRPAFDRAFQPRASERSGATLLDYAQQELARAQNGKNSLTLTAALGNAPRYGTDWGKGDDIYYKLAGRAVPNGLSGVARAIGYELTATTIAPVLADTAGGSL